LSRGRWCLGALVAGYFAIAVVAGAPNSPLTVLLPAGAEPPTWATTLADAARLDHVGRHVLTLVAWFLVLVVLAAFAFLLRQAWAGSVRLGDVLVASAISLGIAVAAPLLLSHDVLTYAAYGRVDALYHHNPYVTRLSSFRHDPFIAVTPGQWVHTHSPYGPLFTLVSAAISRSLWVSATIFGFKLLAGLAVAAATGLVALTAARTRPERAPLAAALVGLNPVLVVHTVGGGHVDALIAAALAAALAIAVTRPPATSVRAIVVTLLLTAACLVKSVIVPALVLWLWWLARRGRARELTRHVAVIAGATVAAVSPFMAGWHTFTPFATLGGVEAWASPSHLVGSVVHATRAVEVAFLLLYVALVWRLARRVRSVTQAWGAALLLLPLSLPYLLPWYAAWFAPFLGLLADEALLLAGVLVTVVLALTLIPADPFHGLTTPAVMDGAHYGAASVLLVVLIAVASRLLEQGPGVATSTVDPRAHLLVTRRGWSSRSSRA
jgi:alpha-1,6-mannosyltransferase